MIVFAVVVTVGSPFALLYILEALARQDRQSEIIGIVRDRWGAMVDRGATSFWETFPGYDPKWWTRSYCHAWSAAPTYFLSRYQLGVWWSEPGYKTARIAPQPVGLTWARGSVPTPQGSIEVDWRSSGNEFAIEARLPRGVAATVELPVPADSFRTFTPTDLKPDVVNNRWQFSLPAGFSAQVKVATGGVVPRSNEPAQNRPE